MSEKETKIWELLAKRESREASAEELAELNVLLNMESKSQIEWRLGILSNYWHSLHAIKDKGMPQKLVAILSEIELDETKQTSTFNTGHISAFFRRSWWKIAAAIVVLAGAVTIITKLLKSDSVEIVSGNGVRKELILPDGTKVRLNSDSKIVYSVKYLQATKREVFLEGEAFFDVKHDGAHPFIIHTNYGIDVQDLGTLFDVRAYPKDGSMETTLLRGSVEVYMAKASDKKLLLHPKQKFIFYRRGSAPKLSNRNMQTAGAAITVSSGNFGQDKFEIANIITQVNKEGDSLVSETAWMQNQLAFNAQSFSELTTRMGKWYNVTFNIKDSSIAAYRFTGVLEGETLTQALDELKMIRPFTYFISNNIVTIDK